MSLGLRVTLMTSAVTVAVFGGMILAPRHSSASAHQTGSVQVAQNEAGKGKVVKASHLTLPHLPQLIHVSQASAEPVRARRHQPEPPAPANLQRSLNGIADDFGETVGIAVSDVSSGWVAEVNGERLYPQQSVSKTWVAMTVMDAIDHGGLQLMSPVTMAEADRSVFNEPLARAIADGGSLTVTVADLLHHALIASDNSANDTLIRVVGMDNVRHMLAEKGLAGITLGADEKHLQALIAGMTWEQNYGVGRNFEQARAHLPVETRVQALNAYLAHPADGASPGGIVRALASLKRGELLSPASTDYMLGVMTHVRTGPERLKGGLAPGWTIAHKTGTGQDFKGVSIGINDVGLLTAPDGHTYAVAVMIPETRQPNQKRLAMMQTVTEAVEHHWQATHGSSSS
jgi:beta-lactamase class A